MRFLLFCVTRNSLNRGSWCSDGLDGPGSVPGSAVFMSTPHLQDKVWGPTHSPIQWVPAALSLGGVKRPGLEADHSPPSSAEVKKSGSIPPLPHICSWRGEQLYHSSTALIGLSFVAYFLQCDKIKDGLRYHLAVCASTCLCSP
jgi:hypothetical protein